MVRGEPDLGKMDMVVLKTHVYWDIPGELKLKGYFGGILDGNHICLYSNHAGPSQGLA